MVGVSQCSVERFRLPAGFKIEKSPLIRPQISPLRSAMSEEIDKHVLKRYDVGQKLGKGAYGIVWKSIDKKSQKLVALKKVYDAFQVPNVSHVSMNRFL